MDKAAGRLVLALVVVLSLGVAQTLYAQFRARDPGVRGGGAAIAGLTADEREMFTVRLEDFSEEEAVEDGIGPRFNFVSCAGCHTQPAIGGTSPAVNPLFRVTADLGFVGNVIPSFITPNGPIREARFQFNADGSRDGGVHALFVITGHRDADRCGIAQEDFERQVRNNNVVFRIPTPVFGADLIEQIGDSTIVGNLAASASTKRSLGISGRVNRNGNDGTIARFGWKAQNKSLLLFSGEAYNVEMGITSELFQQERDETPGCQFATVPNDVTPSVRQIGAIENFANFQRFLAPATPSTERPGGSQSIARGRQQFGRGVTLQDREPLLRPRPAPDGAGPGRRRRPGRGARRRIPDGATVRPRPAHLLPARWPHDRPAGGDPGSPELRQQPLRPVRGQSGR